MLTVISYNAMVTYNIYRSRLGKNHFSKQKHGMKEPTNQVAQSKSRAHLAQMSHDWSTGLKTLTRDVFRPDPCEKEKKLF